MPQVALNGTSIHYEQSGVQGAPALLLSNSLGTTMDMWEPQLEAFRQKYTLIRYDMRGHGKSSVPAGPYTIEQLGGDVIALIEALNLSQVAYCGLSIGGLIGQWLAVNEPEHFCAFIFANTAAKIGNAEGWSQRIATVEQGGLAAIADGGLQRWFTAAFREKNPRTAARMRTMLVSCNPSGYVSACAALRDTDLRDAIGAIDAPVCILAGQHDAVTTIEHAHFMQQQIAGSYVVELPASHISNVEAPAEFKTAVLDFLEQQDSHG
jgi:3-oxoadipate enol-lactonase